MKTKPEEVNWKVEEFNASLGHCVCHVSLNIIGVKFKDKVFGTQGELI